MRPPGWTRRAFVSRVIGASVIAFALVFSNAAHADPTAADIASARRLFSEGTLLRQEGRFAEAAAKLREAIAIKETPGLRFHLAHCEEEAGLLLRARDDYDRAGELIRRGEAASDVAELLEPARAALRERIPTLVVRVPSGARAVGLTIDGDMIAGDMVGSPIQLDPGVHTIIVSAAARDTFRLELTLKEGEDRVAEATLPERPGKPIAAAVAVPHPVAGVQQPTEKRGFGLRESILIGEGVISAAGLGLGVAFAVQSGSRSDRIAQLNANHNLQSDTACGPQTKIKAMCDELHQALIDRGDDNTVALAGFIIAGVGAASLITTWLVWPAPRDTRATRIQIIPVVGGAIARGAF